MALLLSQGPGVSADFIDAVKDCITMGGKYLSNYEFDYQGIFSSKMIFYSTAGVQDNHIG